MGLQLGNLLVDSGKIRVGTLTPDSVYLGINMMWQNMAPPGSETFTASGTFIVPAGYTEVTVCMCGGGGSGGYYDPHIAWSGGGYAGGIVSQVVTGLTGGQEVVVTIGSGGARHSTHGVGNSGTPSFFGVVEAAAGGGGGYGSYVGRGASRTTCGGTFNDGMYEYVGYEGGQAGAFGNGGNAGTNDGGIGAGGGAGYAYSLPSGAGGRGQCVISWS